MSSDKSTVPISWVNMSIRVAKEKTYVGGEAGVNQQSMAIELRRSLTTRNPERSPERSGQYTMTRIGSPFKFENRFSVTGYQVEAFPLETTTPLPA